MNLQACVIRYFPIPVYVLKVVVSAGVRRNLQVQKEPCSAPERKYAGLRTSALPYQRLWLGPSVSWEKGRGTARWGISENRTEVRKYFRKYTVTCTVLPYLYTFKAHDEVFTLLLYTYLDEDNMICTFEGMFVS